MSLQKAIEFAKHKHGEQVRKYTAEPYWKHLEEVSNLVGFLGEEHQIVAWLHDALEDTETTFQEIHDWFGVLVAEDVLFLSDLTPPSEGNRKYRKEKYKEQIYKASPLAQSVKCADLISNTSSIVLHDPGFSKVYLREKEDLLKAIMYADPTLWKLASDMLRLSELALKDTDQNSKGGNGYE